MLTPHDDSDSSRHVPLHCLLGLLFDKMSIDFGGYHCWVLFGVLFVSEKALLYSQGWARTHDLSTSSAEYQKLLTCAAMPNSSTRLSTGQWMLILCLSFSFSGWTFLWVVKSAPRKSGHGTVSMTNGTVAEQCVTCWLKHTDEEDNVNIPSFNISLTMTYRTEDIACHFYTCFLVFKGRAENYRKLTLISVVCNIEILIYTRIPLFCYAMSHSVFFSLLLIYLNLIKLQFYLY